MSKTSDDLEEAVAALTALSTTSLNTRTARQRVEIDRSFATVLRLVTPRIRHFIRKYGLVQYWDDATQCCAIAVHRAVLGYDPTKALFTTFVNWQIRGELQSLRFRVMVDQRPSARRVAATTISLQTILQGAEGEDSALESLIEDQDALARTEAGASDYLAQAATTSLVDRFVDRERTAAIAQLHRKAAPPLAARARIGLSSRGAIDPAELEKLEEKLRCDREIVERRVFEASRPPEASDPAAAMSRDRVRQLTARAARKIAELAATDPSFAMMVDYGPIVSGARRRSAAPGGLQPA